MPSSKTLVATEKCCCGASLIVESEWDSRLREALAEWRVGHKHEPDSDWCPVCRIHVSSGDGESHWDASSARRI